MVPSVAIKEGIFVLTVISPCQCESRTDGKIYFLGDHKQAHAQGYNTICGDRTEKKRYVLRAHIVGDEGHHHYLQQDGNHQNALNLPRVCTKKLLDFCHFPTPPSAWFRNSSLECG
jgi:hypothetical protein